MADQTTRCTLCKMPEKEIVELDLLMDTAEPDLDSKLFGDLEVPPEHLPAGWQRWGKIRKVQIWLEERGIKVRRDQLIGHFERHLPAVREYDGKRVLADGSEAPSVPSPLKASIEYHAFFKIGMESGHRALDLLAARMEDPENPPSSELLLKIATIGTRMAVAQAGIVTRGNRFTVDDEDAASGFMYGNEEPPSQRFGGHRVRTIEGKRVPVMDEGPVDRARYNERARKEGGTELPAPRYDEA